MAIQLKNRETNVYITESNFKNFKFFKLAQNKSYESTAKQGKHIVRFNDEQIFLKRLV